MLKQWGNSRETDQIYGMIIFKWIVANCPGVIWAAFM
jgi:hypothetical protein